MTLLALIIVLLLSTGSASRVCEASGMADMLHSGHHRSGRQSTLANSICDLNFNGASLTLARSRGRGPARADPNSDRPDGAGAGGSGVAADGDRAEPHVASSEFQASVSLGSWRSCQSAKVVVSPFTFHAVLPCAVLPLTTCAAGVGALNA